MEKHIFVGIDLGDKNSVARIAVDREKSERFGFVNNRGGRARLFEEAEAAGRTGGRRANCDGLRSISLRVLFCAMKRKRGDWAVGCWHRRRWRNRSSKKAQERRPGRRRCSGETTSARLSGQSAADGLGPGYGDAGRSRSDAKTIGIGGKANAGESSNPDAAQTIWAGKACRSGSGLDDGIPAWLEASRECGIAGIGSAANLASLLRQLSCIEEEIERIDKLIEQLAARHDTNRSWRN